MKNNIKCVSCGIVTCGKHLNRSWPTCCSCDGDIYAVTTERAVCVCGRVKSPAWNKRLPGCLHEAGKGGD